MNPAGQPDPATQYATLKSSILGAQQAGGASPLGNFPELQGLANLTNPLEAKSQAVAGSAYNAQVQAANIKAEASAKARAQNDMLDASKYTKVPLSDGGYKFIAPNGQEISASQYAQVKGESTDSVLKGSQNPIDVSFQQDFKQLQQYIQDKQNLQGANRATNQGDIKALDRAQAVETQVKQQYGIDLAKENPSQVIQTFMQAYPTVFGLHTTGPQGTGYFLPSSEATKNYQPGGGIGAP